MVTIEILRPFAVCVNRNPGWMCCINIPSHVLPIGTATVRYRVEDVVDTRVGKGMGEILTRRGGAVA